MTVGSSKGSRPHRAARPYALIDLVILTDKSENERYVSQLAEAMPVGVMRLLEARASSLDADVVLVDVDLQDAETIRRVRTLLSPKPRALVVFLIDEASRAQEVQAKSLGGEEVFSRPLDPARFPLVIAHRLGRQEAPKTASELRTEKLLSNNRMAADAIQASFAGLMGGSPFETKTFVRASSAIVGDIDELGVDRWLGEVRRHHSSTYQHCLTVTGLATAFARHLGLGIEGTRRLALAGLVHDIGKARISVEILDKPGRLTDAEFAVMRQHPVRGYDYLKANSDLDEQILGMVRHHHEYLDGSGYPDGLRGDEIDDLTRMMTVCDIYSALIEQRSYKLPMKAEAAFAILENMVADGKLDSVLVRAFRTVAFSIDATMKFAPRRSAKFG